MFLLLIPRWILHHVDPQKSHGIHPVYGIKLRFASNRCVCVLSFSFSLYLSPPSLSLSFSARNVTSAFGLPFPFPRDHLEDLEEIFVRARNWTETRFLLENERSISNSSILFFFLLHDLRTQTYSNTHTRPRRSKEIRKHDDIYLPREKKHVLFKPRFLSNKPDGLKKFRIELRIRSISIIASLILVSKQKEIRVRK